MHFFATINWGTVFTGIIAITGFLGWGGTWLVKQIRNRQGRATGVHDRLLKLEGDMKSIQDWWTGIPSGFLRNGTTGFKDQFSLMTKTVEEHSTALANLKTDIAEVKSMLTSNGGDTDLPGDRLMRMEGMLHDFIDSQGGPDDQHDS